MRKQAESDCAQHGAQMMQISALQDFIKAQPTVLTEFDETLVRRPIGKITVLGDHFTVGFRSGVTVDTKG